MSFVEVRNLTKRYPEGFILNDISFTLEKGEVLTLMGPSGSGKTSLLRNICGLDTPDSGRIIINGRDMTDLPVSKRNVGMIFQDLALFPHMRAYDNIAYSLRNRKENERDIKNAIVALAEKLKIAHLLDRYPAEISGGERQRVALARSVIYSPDLLLLDEPMSSLDMQLRSKTRSEIKSFAKDAGLTMIYVTHDHREGFYMADRAGIMFEGGIESIDTPDHMFSSPATERIARFFGYNIMTLQDRKVAFFPSHIELDDVNPELTGTIVSVGFEGEITRIHVQTSTEKMIELWLPKGSNQKDLSVGSTVGLRIPHSIELPS